MKYIRIFNKIVLLHVTEVTYNYILISKQLTIKQVILCKWKIPKIYFFYVRKNSNKSFFSNKDRYSYNIYNK